MLYYPYIPCIFTIIFWTFPHKFCGNTYLSWFFLIYLFIIIGYWFSASLKVVLGWNFPPSREWAVSITHFCRHSEHNDVGCLIKLNSSMPILSTLFYTDSAVFGDLDEEISIQIVVHCGFSLLLIWTVAVIFPLEDMYLFWESCLKLLSFAETSWAVPINCYCSYLSEILRTWCYFLQPRLLYSSVANFCWNREADEGCIGSKPLKMAYT